MGTDQYHEPASDLSAQTRTLARMFAGLQEEAEAIGWYEQRMSVETNSEAKAIMLNAQTEEMKHFAMDLEFINRQMPVFRGILQGVLFTDDDIVQAGEKAEDEALGD